ncbi:hypothetical protein V2H45_22785 [Tumidithrix elongata RA019]|uniref:Uncharacterized protein n=1 Tax=Tumidithrix elongata BACA0141 TaxID=2716417 RepID=A0AAW9Q8N9_9CYAN|nr:hypothetical protein [Tumidithrix elongata RA019]
MDNGQDRKRCLERLLWAVGKLGGKIDLPQLTKISELIIQTMTGRWRSFHTPDHIFEVGDGGDAIEVIAALFHDLVYVQVDQGVSVNISRYIAPFVKEVDEQLVILEASELQDDYIFTLVALIFGFVPGQSMQPTSGQNEFLSALICLKTLENLLAFSQLVEIAACIEATIPFRPKSSSGLTVSDILYNRLEEANHKFELGWTSENIIQSVKRSVRLANRDVQNFSSPNSAHFLNNTWNLLPETNHDLKNTNSYTVHGYRKSMQKMEGFISFLRPELVFRQYQGEPDDRAYAEMLERTSNNLEVAKLYLGTKLTSIAVLEALSFRIGRDIPLSTMMGELPSEDILVAGLEQFLPCVEIPSPLNNSVEKEVLELLEKGRTLDSEYDVRNSPVATFMVKSSGFDEIRYLLQMARQFFEREIDSEVFLASCNSKVIGLITEAVLKLFEARKVSMSRGYSL